MDFEGGEMLVEEVLEAQSHIWSHIFSFINPMALKCAVQLGIPDAIHRHGPRPMPLSQLVSALQLSPQKTHYVYRLMRTLVHSGFFVTQKVSQNGEEEKEEVGYVLTNSSRLLLQDNPLNLAPYLFYMSEPFRMEPWQFLSVWFQSEDRTPFDTAHGTSFWEYMGSNPRDSNLFNAAMASDSRLVMSALMGKYKYVFEGLSSLVDVGGGIGTVAKVIAETFPKIECTVFDLPQVVANLKGKGNLKYVEGDMFEVIPPADTLLLKAILHDWNDEECVKILKKCKEAITDSGKGGKIIIIDAVVGEEKKDMFTQAQLFLDMSMMALVGGKERNEKEWTQLFSKVGFRDYKIFPIGLKSLIDLYP